MTAAADTHTTPMAVEARIITGQEVCLLETDQIVTVPSSDVVISISGVADRAPILLDGRERPFHEAGGSRILAIDLTRSTGFHHLHVTPGRDYFFATEDAKTGLNGIKEMLSFLSSAGTAWSGQLLFSDGSFLRDHEVVYGWLDQHADSALLAIARVAATPRMKRTTNRVTTNRASDRPLVSSTLKLLRSSGHELLDESPVGILEVGAKRYSPRKIVASRAATTIDTPANRRVVHTCVRLLELANDVRVETSDEEVKARCHAWADSAQRVLTMSPLASLLRYSQAPPAAIPSSEEQVIPDYTETYRVFALLTDQFEWTPSLIRQPQHSYISYSDEIYQAFVVHVVAVALGLSPQAAMLGTKQPAFVGPTWSLYSNVVPPSHIVRSWRSHTSRPDYFRPDLLFVRDGHKERVALGDAKYRNDGYEASESSRKELLAYMAAFGTSSALIFYPPTPKEHQSIRTIEWNDQRIIEIPISPTEGLIPFLKERLASALDQAAFEPRWSG